MAPPCARVQSPVPHRSFSTAVREPSYFLGSGWVYNANHAQSHGSARSRHNGPRPGLRKSGSRSPVDTARARPRRRAGWGMARSTAAAAAAGRRAPSSAPRLDLGRRRVPMAKRSLRLGRWTLGTRAAWVSLAAGTLGLAGRPLRLGSGHVAHGDGCGAAAPAAARAGTAAPAASADLHRQHAAAAARAYRRGRAGTARRVFLGPRRARLAERPLRLVRRSLGDRAPRSPLAPGWLGA